MAPRREGAYDVQRGERRDRVRDRGSVPRPGAAPFALVPVLVVVETIELAAVARFRERAGAGVVRTGA